MKKRFRHERKASSAKPALNESLNKDNYVFIKNRGNPTCLNAPYPDSIGHVRDHKDWKPTIPTLSNLGIQKFDE